MDWGPSEPLQILLPLLILTVVAFIVVVAVVIACSLSPSIPLSRACLYHDSGIDNKRHDCCVAHSHGWGGNTMIMGGGLKGKQVLGRYPENLLAIEGRGRWIPTTPWEGMWYGIAEWMGVHRENMETLLPFAANFEVNKTLYSKAQLYHD